MWICFSGIFKPLFVIIYYCIKWFKSITLSIFTYTKKTKLPYKGGNTHNIKVHGKGGYKYKSADYG